MSRFTGIACPICKGKGNLTVEADCAEWGHVSPECPLCLGVGDITDELILGSSVKGHEVRLHFKLDKVETIGYPVRIVRDYETNLYTVATRFKIGVLEEMPGFTIGDAIRFVEDEL